MADQPVSPAGLAEDLHAIADTLDALGAAGACVSLRRSADLLVELDAALAVERRYRTLGGPPPPSTPAWANQALPPPPSAASGPPRGRTP